MHDMVKTALHHLAENWDIEIMGSSELRELIGFSAPTLKTRLARGQARALRDNDGRKRAALCFTGSHLVYNLIADRLLRYGIPWDGEKGAGYLAHVYSEWVLKTVLTDPLKADAALRIIKQETGENIVHAYADDDVMDFTGDAAIIIPIGTMVTRMAVRIYARHEGPDFYLHFHAKA